MRILKAIYKVFAAVIDFKLGLAGALFLGIVVFFINCDHGWQSGLVAGGKQAFYTFFFGGFITKLCEYLSTRIDKKFWAIALGTLVPTLLSIAATFGVHTFRGTPEPLNSTLPTMIITFPAFIGISLRKRKKYQQFMEFQKQEREKQEAEDLNGESDPLHEYDEIPKQKPQA